MALNFEEVNILGNIINDSWGKGSTNDYDYQSGGDGYSNWTGMTKVGPGNESSVACKGSLRGNRLTITALSVINLASLNTQHQEITKCENELNQYVKKYIADVKKTFKKKDHAGRTLKCKQIENSDRNSVEMLNHYAENRRVIVRRSIDFEVG
jgi:hypothetical protein